MLYRCHFALEGSPEAGCAANVNRHSPVASITHTGSMQLAGASPGASSFCSAHGVSRDLAAGLTAELLASDGAPAEAFTAGAAYTLRIRSDERVQALVSVSAGVLRCALLRGPLRGRTHRTGDLSWRVTAHNVHCASLRHGLQHSDTTGASPQPMSQSYPRCAGTLAETDDGTILEGGACGLPSRPWLTSAAPQRDLSAAWVAPECCFAFPDTAVHVTVTVAAAEGGGFEGAMLTLPSDGACDCAAHGTLRAPCLQCPASSSSRYATGAIARAACRRDAAAEQPGAGGTDG